MLKAILIRNTSTQRRTARAKQHKSRKIHPLEALPFVSRRKKGGFNYWDVKPTGDYVRDCGLGASYAQAFIAHLRTIGGCTILAMIVMDMQKNYRPLGRTKSRPYYSGAERGLIVGFMGGISRLSAYALHAIADISAMNLGLKARPVGRAHFWLALAKLAAAGGYGMSDNPNAESRHPKILGTGRPRKTGNARSPVRHRHEGNVIGLVKSHAK